MKRQSKKRLSLMLTAMMLLSNISYASNDINGHWASETMARWQSQGLIKGDEKGNLNPDKSITRAEFITIVNKVMEYSKTGDKIKNYKDLKQNDWYYSQIMTALEQGYINGTSADTMSPNKDITRQEVMVIINNIAGLKQSKFDLSAVKDQDKIASWAKNAATNMIANGYITGYQGKINPSKAMKRAEAITLLDAYKQNNRTISFQGQYSLGKANKVTLLTGNIQINDSQIKELIINKDTQGKIELTNTKIEKITNNSKETKIYLQGKEVEIKDGKIVEQQTTQDKKYKDGKYTGKAKGYKSDVEVEVEIKDGKIVKIDVKQQEDPLYWNVAKTVIDRILQKQTPQVDASTGATITSKAIMYAVEEALEKAQIKKQEIQGNKELKDGKYIGQATGYRGIMRVEVEIKDGKIVEITLLSHSDDAGYIDSAKNILKDIKKKQTADVTAISGATFSSDGIKNAVKDALEQAKGKTTKPGESEYAKKNQKAAGGGGGGGGGSSVPPTQNMTFTNLNDGVYEGEAKGFNSSKNIKVKVTVQGGVITDISLIDHGETAGYFGEERARILAQRIIDKKSSDVDIISGATFSSRGFINAVVNAVKQVASSLNVSAKNDGSLTTFDANGKSYIDGALNGSGNNPKILLSNAKIDNDLVIRNTMVEGEVTLNNVKVDGTLIIQGGGDNSVKLINSKINNIIVDKQRGDRVNVVIDADTVVRGKVSVKTPAQIKTAGDTKIATLELSPALFSQSSDEKYKTKIDAKVQTLDIQSLNANIVIEATSKIDKLKLPSAFGQYEKNKPEYTNNNFKIEIKDANSITSSENTNTTSRILYGDYNVDQVNYPQVAPFIHPPFYNMRVRVVVDSDNKIIEVANNNTGIEGVGTGPAWSRHQKYWNRMIAGNLFAKFVGKNLDQVKNMDMRTGGVDTVAGATANSIAVKEAVINAFEERAGRGFLNDTQTLKAQQIENPLGTTAISFTNTLPADFDIRLHSVSHGIYNAKTKIQGANLSQDGTTLNIPSNLKAGHYYVNIVDANKKYRSPDFEGGLAEDGHYPYFIIKSNANLGYDSAAKKLTVSDGDLANVYENVQHIIIKDKSKIGTKVPGRNGAMVDYTGMEIDTIGHHGTIGTAATEIFDENTGAIKPNARIGRAQTLVFENGITYVIEVKVLGYSIINFEYTANETNKILEGDANVDQGNYPLVEPFIHPPFFNARVKVEITPEGKIVSVKDNKTGELGLAPGATKEFWTNKNKSYWDALVNAKFFDKFTGKTLDEVKQMKVKKGEIDVVAGATANSKAVKQAVINAIEKRAGKKFLNSNQTLKVTSSPILLSTATPTTDVMLTNTLPSDFELELMGVVAGVYNSTTGTVSGASLDNTGTKLTIPTNLKAGHYYINVIDRSGKYRSPDFETRGGIHYPHFVIKNEATLNYDNVAKKISVSDSDLENVFNNIHEINVKDKSKIGTTVPGRDGQPVVYSGISIEPVGHHGNVNENAKTFFNADGSINTAYKSRGKEIFESGKRYIIELDVWGFEQKLEFELSI